MKAAANSNSRAGSSVFTSDWSMAMIRFWLAALPAAAGFAAGAARPLLGRGHVRAGRVRGGPGAARVARHLRPWAGRRWQKHALARLRTHGGADGRDGRGDRRPRHRPLTSRILARSGWGAAS